MFAIETQIKDKKVILMEDNDGNGRLIIGGEIVARAFLHYPDILVVGLKSLGWVNSKDKNVIATGNYRGWTKKVEWINYPFSDSFDVIDDFTDMVEVNGRELRRHPKNIMRNLEAMVTDLNLKFLKPMEDKQDNTLIELSNFDDYLNSLESEAYHYYDKHIEQFNETKTKIVKRVFLINKLSIEECRETLGKIAKYNSIIEDILTEKIMDYAVVPNKFDKVKSRFDERNSLVLGIKNIFEKFIITLNLRIEELRDIPQHKP